MDGTVYFRPHNCKSLKKYTYSSENTEVTYHQRLWGRRHRDLQKKVRSCRESRGSNTEGHEKFSQSLYGICTQFIISNLTLVDSFAGFPSLIAEEIFSAAISCGQLSNHRDNRLLSKIQLFTDAYGAEMLETLSLYKKGMFLAQYLDEIAVFLPYLHSIKLSDCQIGDEHEILLQLGNLHQLKYLNLSVNELGDAGVKNLVQAQQRGKWGLDCLEYLNLSQNCRFTPSVLSYVGIIPSLKAVSLSISDIASVSSKFSTNCKCAAGHANELDITVPEGAVGVGWGRKLIEKWLCDFETAEKQKSIKTKGNWQLPFYKVKMTSQSNGIGIEKIGDAPICRPPLILCLCDSITPPKKFNSKKRSFQSSRFASNSRPKRSKLDCNLKPFCDFDDENLLLTYKFT